jgi:2-C-methyl-D-erythritol 4-phosphate cytidylyltransferase
MLASQTPQAFNLRLLHEAYESASDAELETGTECLNLTLQHAQVHAALVPGPASLFKVSSPHPGRVRVESLTVARCIGS